MPNFAEMVALTVEQTRRPEVSAITSAAVRTAVLRAHHVDFFPRDLKEGLLNYAVSPTAMYYDFPNIFNALPLLRSIKNVYSLTVDGYQVEQLEWREVDDRYDSDGAPRRYLYTLQGDTLRCYFDMPTGIAQVYYYANPDVSGVTFGSWICESYPDQVAAWAASIVMTRLGFRELANDINENQVKPFKEQLLASHLLGTVN